MKCEKLNVSDIEQHLTDEIDLFICCASYEDRCRTIADRVPKGRVRRAIIAEMEHTKRYVSENGEYLRRLFGDAGAPAKLEPTDPVITADALRNALHQELVREGVNVLVDITTFTHEALLILTQLLVLNLPTGGTLRFSYASAAEYSVGVADDQKWLSKGVSEVRSVLGFPGEMRPSRPQHLIVLVGFEHERAAELIKAYEPSVISLGHGRSGTATSEKHDVANKHFHRLVSAIASTYGEVRPFEFSCSDPVETQAAIERQMRGLRSYNTVVAPMNTKLSTLGVVLAAQKDGAIQLCYARANQYNYRAYSSPGDTCYLLELPELFTHMTQPPLEGAGSADDSSDIVR